MLPVLIQKFSQSKHYPNTTFLLRKTVHNLCPSPKFPEGPLYNVGSSYLIPMSVRKGIKGKTLIQVFFQTLYSFRHYHTPSLLPLLKTRKGLFSISSIEDPFRFSNHICFKSLGTVSSNISYLMHHTPLDGNSRKETLSGMEKPGITIKHNKERICKPPSPKVKQKVFPTPDRFSSSQDKPQKLPSTTLSYPYGTKKGLFAYPVPSYFEVYGIKKEIPYRLLYGSVKVRNKFLLKGFVEIRDLRRAILYSPDDLTYCLYLPGRYPSQKYLRDHSSYLPFSPLPPLEYRGEETLLSLTLFTLLYSRDENTFYYPKSCLKVLEKIAVPIVFPLKCPLIRKTSYKGIKLLVNSLVYYHSYCFPYLSLKGFKELLRTFNVFFFIFLDNFFFTYFCFFSYTFHKAYAPFFLLTVCLI